MANRPMMLALIALFGAGAMLSPAYAQDGGGKEPFQLGVTQTVQGAAGASGYAAYPVPKMIGIPKVAPVQKPPKEKPRKPLNANLQQNQAPQFNMGAQQNIQQPPQRPPMQAAVQASPPGVLPTQFMGNWTVIGQRQNIQARPEYQNGIENIFTGSNSQTWNIVGGPGGYSMSSTTGVQQVQVGQCNQQTAFLRYQHPVGNTQAQEAIVMQLSPDGQTFQGMQRITIKKQGEGSPRAQVTYQLMGRRQ